MIDGKNGVVEISSFDLSVDEVFTGQKIASADPREEKHILKYVFFACLTYNLQCIYMVTLDDKYKWADMIEGLFFNQLSLYL